MDETTIIRSLFDPELRPKVDAWFARQNIKPIDLRNIHPDLWDTVLHLPLSYPPDIAAYLDVREKTDFSTIEVDAIEEAMDRFYRVRPPYTILISRGIPALLKVED